MRKLFLVALFCTLSVGAWAQNFAPADRMYWGPTLGQQWTSPDGAGTQQFNAQTGTSYTVVASDMGKVLTFSNGSAIAVTLPQAGTAGFEAGKCFVAITIGAGTMTITPTTSTINGQTSKAYVTNLGTKVCSDGTNYYAY